MTDQTAEIAALLYASWQTEIPDQPGWDDIKEWERDIYRAQAKWLAAAGLTLAPQPDPASRDIRGQLDLLIHVAQDVVRDAGTEKWPVNLDRLRMALYEIGALEASDD